MKVNAWKNLDIEVEVDVTLDDCINEFHDIAEKDKEMPRRLLTAVDGATKILAKINPEMVKLGTIGGNVKEIVRERIQQWFDWLQEKE